MKRKPAKQVRKADIVRGQRHLLDAMRNLTRAFHELRQQVQRRDEDDR